MKRRHSGQRIPDPPCECLRPEVFKTPGVVLTGGVHMAERVFHAPQQILSLRHDRRVAGIVGQRDGTRQGGARLPDVSQAVPHRTRSKKRFRFDDPRRRQVQDLLAPPQALGCMATNVPEEPQAHRNVSRFSETIMFDEPRQGTAVALEVVTHAIQPFNLRGADQRLSRLGASSGPKAPQPPQGVVDFVCSGELRGAYARTVSSMSYSGRVATEVSVRSRRLLSI